MDRLGCNNEGYREIGLNEGYMGVPRWTPNSFIYLILVTQGDPNNFSFFSLLQLAASRIGINEGYRALNRVN